MLIYMMIRPVINIYTYIHRIGSVQLSAVRRVSVEPSAGSGQEGRIVVWSRRRQPLQLIVIATAIDAGAMYSMLYGSRLNA